MLLCVVGKKKSDEKEFYDTRLKIHAKKIIFVIKIAANKNKSVIEFIKKRIYKFQ